MTGGAEGRNSRQMTDVILGELRKASGHPTVSIVRNDLTGNDFSTFLSDSMNTRSSKSGGVLEFIRPA